jgi:putative transposase
VPARFPKKFDSGDRVTSLTVKRDGDTWIIQAATEGPDLKPLKPTGVALGVDLGVTNSTMDSQGVVRSIRDITPDEAAHRARLQQRIARSKRGSRRQGKLRQQAARLMRLVANRRRHDQHMATLSLVRAADHLVIEDLHVDAMTASARGTVEKPGRRVAQKAGLNRVVLGVGFGEIRRQLTYKAQWYGRRLTVVPAPGTSQTCSKCGYRSPENRKTQAEFRCQRCPHVDHADHNAADVILSLGQAKAGAEDAALLLAAPGAPVRVTKARRRRNHFRRRDSHANPDTGPTGAGVTVRT